MQALRADGLEAARGHDKQQARTSIPRVGALRLAGLVALALSFQAGAPAAVVEALAHHPLEALRDRLADLAGRLPPCPALPAMAVALSLASGVSAKPAASMDVLAVLWSLTHLNGRNFERDGLPSLAPWIAPEVQLFSTQVAGVSIGPLRRGELLTTEGTDIRVVTEHLLRSKAERALIVTDGWVGHVPDEHARALNKRRVRVEAAITDGGEADFMHPLGGRCSRLRVRPPVPHWTYRRPPGHAGDPAGACRRAARRPPGRTGHPRRHPDPPPEQPGCLVAVCHGRCPAGRTGALGAPAGGHALGKMCDIMMAQFIPENGMDSFTIRDLRERTGDLVRNAEAGQLSVVAKHGHPLFVAVPLDETVLGQGVNVALACRLFQDKTLSLAKASRLAGLSAESFIEQLGALGIPVVDYPPVELDEEIAALEA